MSYQTRRQTLQILYVQKIKVSINHPSKSNVNTSNNYVLYLVSVPKNIVAGRRLLRDYKEI